MWNLCSSSKLVAERSKQQSYDIHQKKLRKMKSKMKITPPSQPDFVYSKHKLEMSRRDRLMEIDYQNDILLNKMKKISVDNYTTNKLRPEAQNLKTLNQHVMNLQADDIYFENKRICQKLLKINSYYPTIDIIDKTDHLEKVRFNISENARRSKSTAQLRPQSSLTYRSSKFYRSKVNRFDEEGNSSQENIYKYMRVESSKNIRPQTAPTKSKPKRPYSSENSNQRSKKTYQAEIANMEENESIVQ